MDESIDELVWPTVSSTKSYLLPKVDQLKDAARYNTCDNKEQEII